MCQFIGEGNSTKDVEKICRCGKSSWLKQLNVIDNDGEDEFFSLY